MRFSGQFSNFALEKPRQAAHHRQAAQTTEDQEDDALEEHRFPGRGMYGSQKPGIHADQNPLVRRNSELATV